MSRLLSALLIFSLVTVAPTFAEDAGKFDGAVWNYEMSKVSGKGGARKGRIRISGQEIFQPRKGKSTVIGTIVDKPKDRPEKGDKVKVKFSSLRGDDKKELALDGVLELDSFGEVHGRFVDGGGIHWNFKASRVEE